MTETAGQNPQPARSGFHVPVWIAIVLGGLIVAGVAFAIGVAVGDHRGDGNGVRAFNGRVVDAGNGHPGFRFLVLLILIGLVITGIVLIVHHYSSGSRNTRNAEDLLDERLARGEIDEADYRARRAALRG